MKLMPAVATPGAGHAGRTHVWGVASAPSLDGPRRFAGCGPRPGGVRSRPSHARATWTRDRIIRATSLGTLLVLTALLYLVGLSASGYANEFYSAAAQAGSTNWWSLLWGSSDAGNSITVDKPPASIWVMALSVRLFGLSSWSILVPQALMGVACVAVLYRAVSRDFGHWCGLLAGLALATTPVACLMFRFNNPDALLMLLLVGSASCLLRVLSFGRGATGGVKGSPTATEEPATVAGPSVADNRRRTAWMALAGALMGLAFLTKQLQAFLVLPGFGVAFLVASPTRLRRRLLDAVVALGALALAAGWWVLLTVVVPAGMRPYIGGSETNSFVELTFWYNGLGRIFGNTVGNGSMASQGILMGTGGEASLARLLSAEWGTQWSWLFPAALVGLVVVVAAAGRSPRTDGRRAQAIVWGGWLLVTFVTFSYMEGTIHQYYTVALAPATAALAAMGARVLWERREAVWARAVAALAAVLGAGWSVVLVARTSWHVTLLAGAVATLLVAALALGVACALLRGRGSGRVAMLSRACAGLAIAACLVVPVAHSLYTAAQGHHGSIVTAGPSVEGASGMGAPGGAGGTGNGGAGNGSAGGIGAGGAGNGGLPGDGAGGAANGGLPDGGAGAAGSDANSDGGGDSGSADGPGNGDGSDGMGAQGMVGGGMRSRDGGSVPSDGGSAAGSDGSASSGAGSGAVPGDGAASASDPDGAASGSGQVPDGSDGAPSAGGSPAGGDGGGMGAMLGMGGGTSVSSEVESLLLEDADSYTWVAAAIGSQSAAGYQLATERAVMPIGGFNGTDPSPMLDQFKEYVSEGRIHYFIAGGQGGGGRGGASSDSSEITSWVEENFESVTVDGVTLYDLTQPKA